MKKIFLLSILIITTASSVFSQVFKNNDVTISQLENQVWVVETSDNTTMYIVEGKDKAMLIDTGTKCADLDKIVRKITNKPLYVVLTHFHPDHAGNLAFFDKIYMHRGDTSLVRMMPISYNGKYEYVNDGDIFDLGGKKIEVVFTPGHTPGSIVLIDRQTGSCFSGDAFGSGQVWLQLQPHLPITIYAESCRKMEKIMDEQHITKIYCGHYPYVKKAYDKSYLTDMRKLAEAMVNGTAPKAEEYNIKVGIGTQNPMIVTLGQAGIVYDPDHIKD